jgi:competence protein ComEA
VNTKMNVFGALILALLVGIGGPAYADDAKGSMAPLAVNINTADAETLAVALDGVGASRARAIVEYRDAHGPFRSVDDLAQVKGIGERVVAANRTRITVKE